MMLLTDGTVMVQTLANFGNGAEKLWMKLTPDLSGSYVNGTWSTITPMGSPRLFFGSTVLPSGKVFVVGGEYSTQSDTNTGEIYDPVTNTWTPTPNFPQANFGDDYAILLPNGKVLCGYLFGPQTYLYEPTSNTWAQSGTKLRNDASDEENWALLPGGIVLSYDIFSSITLNQGHAQKYNTATGLWSDAGNVPVILSTSAVGFELGPTTLLPDGRVLVVGANNLTAIYTPSTNSWVQGPSLPANMGADDAPGAMLPTGQFLFAADTSLPLNYTSPTKLYSFDYTTNAITDVTPAALSSYLDNPSFVFRMLVLPNGHILLGSETSNIVWEYAPSGTPQASWAPTIVGNPVKNSDGSYTLMGTQLTGISEGAKYGDDAQMASNYPIVRITAGNGNVYYAKTTGWTPGVATGGLQTTVNFAVPAGVTLGTYNVSVIANGIPSANHPMFFGGTPSNVTALYTNGTLVITGDVNPNSVTVTLQSGKITVQGANGTTINGTSSYSAPVSGNWTLAVDMGAGDDSIAMIGVGVATANVLLGTGNDKAAFTLSTIGTLTIDGGAGTDVLMTTSSKFTTLKETNFP